VSNERGSVVVMVAVSLFMMMALAAFAIDLAALRDAKAQAQQDADVIALAGASAFRDRPWTDATTVDEARTRAKDIARQNKVWNDTLFTPTIAWHHNAIGGLGPTGLPSLGEWTDSMRDVTLNIVPDSQIVRAWVRRAGIRTFFAKLLGRPFGHVQAMATAWATTNGPLVNCLKPFVIPDMWYESNKTTQDVNHNNFEEPDVNSTGNTQVGEVWKFEPPSVGGTDYYLPFNPNVPDDPAHPQTGYGSAMRSGAGFPGDVGSPMFIKPQTGGGNDSSNPPRMGNQFWLLDLDPTMGVRDEIATGCFSANVGDQVPDRSGSVTGPTRQGVHDLYLRDPGATWNQSTKQVEGSAYPDWTKSPRVITVGLVDPNNWVFSGKNTKPDANTKFTNFARMFILDSDQNANIQAIFLGTAPGGGGGPTGGSLVKVLQLIQ
jgi:hypothetical protein